MGYFDGLTDAIFKKDKTGNTVFYPWGVLGKGRVLSDPAKADQLRSFVRNYYLVTLPTLIVLGILRSLPLLIGIGLLLILWFLIRCRALLAGTPYSDERLTLKEGYKNSAASHNRLTLWVLLTSSVLFVIVGILIALKAHTFVHALFGLGTTVFFGACCAAIGYMLKVKHA
jgi:hypothetical protein